MANIREIQSRIRSVRDTMKITNAMYMIASTKLRKARKSHDNTQEYFLALQDMIDRIKRHKPDLESVYFDNRDEKAKDEKVRGIIAVTADKGLAGAYNHNVLKIVQNQLKEHERTKIFMVGEVGRHFFLGKKIDVAEHFYYSAQNPSLHRARVISERVIEQFLKGELDEVYIVYTSMKNSMACEPKMMKLLPMSMEEPTDCGDGIEEDEDLIFKPTPVHVINNIIPDCIMGYVYGALVESFCSEQNSRMLAMEAANKNAQVMIHDLGIEYNRVRQAMITQEITEVVAGAKAQKKKRAKKKEAVRNEQ